MKFLLVPVAVFLTVVVAGVMLSQQPAPVIPAPPQFSMTTVNSLLSQKNKQIDDYEISNTLQAEQIEQLKTALVAKQAELDKAKEACASSSVAAPDKKGKR